MERTIIVGDIHSCYEELMSLLSAVGFGGDDRLIALGDVIDRGPEPRQVLEFFRTRANVTTLTGNHERKHLRAARGELRAALSQEITRAQLGDEYDWWLGFLGTFPRHMELDDAVLVHGFMEPGVPLDEQRDEVVIGTLSGEAYLKDTDAWPWFELYDGDKPVVVGHRDYLGTGDPLVHEGRIYGIDTGCYRGGRLTALVLPGFDLVSVPSRADHWTQTKRRYALLRHSNKADCDLDWATLEACAEGAENEDLPETMELRARACDNLRRRCEMVVEHILDAVERTAQELDEQLCVNAGREELSDRERAALFAREVQARWPAGGSFAKLLFLARRRQLSASNCYQIARTPRTLSALARELGIDCDLVQDE